MKTKLFFKVAILMFNILIAQGYINCTQCGEISAGLDLDCDYPPMGGTTEDLVLMNYGDIESVTRNATNKQVVEAITINSLVTAYKYEGKNESLEPQANLVKQRYADCYDHEVMFIIFLNTPAATALPNGQSRPPSAIPNASSHSSTSIPANHAAST